MYALEKGVNKLVLLAQQVHQLLAFTAWCELADVY